MNPTIYQPGQVFQGSYAIERLHARSPVSESYLARRIATRQEVILTCSRLDQPKSGPSLRASFRSNAAKLLAANVEGVPRVLAADVTNGTYWVVREHFADAIPLWDYLRADSALPPKVAELRKEVLRTPVSFYPVLVISVGALIAGMLDGFSAAGIHHGGLNPARTVALRGGIASVVLETGYGSLFGAGHFTPPPDEEAIQAPECIVNDTPDELSDIYCFGMVLQSIWLLGVVRDRVTPPALITRAIARLIRPDRSQRIQTFNEVHNLFYGLHEDLLAAAANVKKEGNAAPSDVESTAPGASMPPRGADTPPTPLASGVALLVAGVAVPAPQAAANDTDAPISPPHAAIELPGALPPDVRRPLSARFATALRLRFLWVAAGIGPLLVGLAALRLLPFFAHQMMYTHSAVESVHHLIGGHWRATQPRSWGFPPNPTRAEPETRRRLHPVARHARSFVEWSSSVRVVKATRREANE